MAVVLPVPKSIYEQAVLLDTSALVAIVDQRDKFNDKAAMCMKGLREKAYPFYVTTLTIAETHRLLVQKSYLGRELVLPLLGSFYDGSYNIERPCEEDERTAIGYIRRFADQALTFTDATSMAIMKRLGIRTVFTFDWHFTLLGFRVIP